MLLTASCKSSDTGITPSDQVGITAATFGALRRQNTTGNSYSTYTPSSLTYPIFIDHIKGEIYNPDSLPVRTIPSKILLNLSFKNNSSGVLETMEKKDSFAKTYYATDTLDFSKPRKIRVTSSDKAHSKDYTIDVRIHKVGVDSLKWTRMNVCDAIKGKKLITLKALSSDDAFYLLAADTTVVATNLYCSVQVLKTTDGNTWSTEYNPAPTKITVPFAQFKRPTMAVYKNKVYLLYDGQLRCSDDWTINKPCNLRAILGGFEDLFYGVNDQKNIEVAIGGNPMAASFVPDGMEEMPYVVGDSLPYNDYNFIATNLLTDPSMGRAIILANKENDAKNIKAPNVDKAVIWSKIIDDVPQDWCFMTPAWNNHYKVLPRMAYLSATSYADGIIATGGYPNVRKLYFSNDWGTTWVTKDTIKLPAGFQGAAQVAIVADDTYIYLIDGSNGEIWRGRRM
jgi:hypothetical protein